MRARTVLKGVGLTLTKAFNFKITPDILLHMISKLWHLLLNAVTAVSNITTISQLLRSAGASYGLDHSPRAEHLSVLRNVHTGCEAHPAPGPMHTGTLPSELTWHGFEAHQPLPATAEVTNEWSYASAPPVCLHGMVFTFAFINIISSLIFMLLFERC
jgi:hypothetical protein